MTISAEQLAAYADGELDELTAARVRREIDDNPALASELSRLTALRAMLAARFDPILEETVPERLRAPIDDAAKVISLDDVRQARRSFWQRPPVRFGFGAAIAASLVVTVLVGRHGGTETYADVQLAAALDGTLSGQAAPDGTRLLISFRDGSGAMCRGYAAPATSGIACHDDRGWKLKVVGATGKEQSAQYRQAGSADSAVMAQAQEMASGPAFDAAAEVEARQSGWSKHP